MKATTAPAMTDQTIRQIERFMALWAGSVIVGTVLFLLFSNSETVRPQLFFIVHIVLLFSTAILGMVIPGFFGISWAGRGFLIRFLGACVLFVPTFFYT